MAVPWDSVTECTWPFAGAGQQVAEGPGEDVLRRLRVLRKGAVRHDCHVCKLLTECLMKHLILRDLHPSDLKLQTAASCPAVAERGGGLDGRSAAQCVW